MISQFRAQALGERFSMLDLTQGGLAIALAGVAFIVTSGWRLIPKDRKGKAAEQESFEVTDYSTELRVGDDSAIIGKTVAELERESEGAITVIGIVRNERRLIGRLLYESVKIGRAHVCTPVTNAYLVCRLRLEKKTKTIEILNYNN